MKWYYLTVENTLLHVSGNLVMQVYSKIAGCSSKETYLPLIWWWFLRIVISSSLSICQGPHDIIRAFIHHCPLLHLAVAHQWTLVVQTCTPNLVGRGFSATTTKGLPISHMSAPSHANHGNNSRPDLHSNKEAVLVMKESMLCMGCPLQKCETVSKI